MDTTALSGGDGQALVVARPAKLDEHPAAVYIARLSRRSKRTMRDALDNIAQIVSGGRSDAETLAWERLRYQHTAAIRSALCEAISSRTGKRYSRSTINLHLAALRGVLKECWRLGKMIAEDYRRAADIPAVKGKALPKGRALSQGELRALFAACGADSTPAGARDACLLAVLYGAGLRRAEAVALKLDDYDVETGKLRVECGKGNKDRAVYATNGGRGAIEAWLRVRGSEPGALLCPVRKGGAVQVRSMTPEAVLHIVRRRAKQAGVRQFSPHDMRRSMISDLLDAGADIASVQRLAGHSSPATTAAYDRRGERAKRQAAELLHIPFVAATCERGRP